MIEPLTPWPARQQLTTYVIIVGYRPAGPLWLVPWQIMYRFIHELPAGLHPMDVLSLANCPANWPRRVIGVTSVGEGVTYLLQ